MDLSQSLHTVRRRWLPLQALRARGARARRRRRSSPPSRRSTERWLQPSDGAVLVAARCSPFAARARGARAVRLAAAHAVPTTGRSRASSKSTARSWTTRSSRRSSCSSAGRRTRPFAPLVIQSAAARLGDGRFRRLRRSARHRGPRGWRAAAAAAALVLGVRARRPVRRARLAGRLSPPVPRVDQRQRPLRRHARRRRPSGDDRRAR